MTVIDKILNEWSYRCDDGIVDMNNPAKRAILDVILKENNIELDEKTTSRSTKYPSQQKQDQSQEEIISEPIAGEDDFMANLTAADSEQLPEPIPTNEPTT